MRKLQTTLTVILILIAAFLWAAKPTQATRRESGPAQVVAAQAEPVRVILIGPGW